MCRPARGYHAGLLAALLIGSSAPAADGPNLLAEVSRTVVSAAIGDTRDRPETVNDLIRGTRITGGGRSHSELGIEFAPSHADLILAEHPEVTGVDYAVNLWHHTY